MSPEQDAELLRAWCEGDRRAGDTLLSHYFDPVARYVFHKVGQGETAEEIIQEAFKEAVDRRHLIKGRFGSYVRGIARFKVLEYYRCKGSLADELTSALAADEHGAESMLGISEEGHHIAKALRMLTPERQELLYLFYVEGLSSREIAEIRGIRTSQIAGQVYRACTRVRELVEQFMQQGAQRESTLRRLDTWLRQFEQADDPGADDS